MSLKQQGAIDPFHGDWQQFHLLKGVFDKSAQRMEKVPIIPKLLPMSDITVSPAHSITDAL